MHTWRQEVTQMVKGKLSFGLVLGGICMLAPNMSLADEIIQEIKNQSAITTANDLTLVFTQKVTRVVPVDKAGMEGDEISSLISGKTDFSWNPGELPSAFAPGDSASIRFTGPKGTRIDKTKSFWTKDHAEIVDALASLGAPPNVMFSASQAFAEFTDPETVAVVYSDIRLFRNNDLANLNL